MLEKNKLYLKLENNAQLKSSVEDCYREVHLLLQKYSKNFPTYTDHSIEHTSIVAQNASDILTHEDIDRLNNDEAYVLLMACLLHDIGMCIGDEDLNALKSSEDYKKILEVDPKYSIEDYLRDIHHIKSEEFINQEWEKLKIRDERYAKAIGLIAKAHRKVKLDNFNEYEPKFFIQPTGSEYVCLPFLGCIIRLADEMDITYLRTPDLLFKYHIPDNDKSKEEWEKHKSVRGVNLDENKIIIRGETNNPIIYNALKRLSEKIESVLKESQKIICLLPTLKCEYKLRLIGVENHLIPKGFVPKNIGFSFDFDNVFNTFIGKNLYDSNLVSIREAIQNAIDTCRYKQTLIPEYKPHISVEIKEKEIIISDNGLGMDDYVIRNYFGKLCSSYYQSNEIKEKYEAIGIFGVGVFSYFLICDHFEVETKSLNKEPIKFQVTKSAQNDFYFFNNSTKNEVGTDIILHTIESTNLEEITSYIEHIFYFIEIPLVIKNNGESKFLSKWTDNITNYDEEKYHRFKGEYWLERDKYKSICKIYDSKEVIGYLNLYYNSETNKILFIQNESTVEFHKQGVLTSHNNSIIPGTEGKLNFKTNNKLNVARNAFIDQDFIETTKIQIDLEIDLLLDLYNSIDKSTLSSLVDYNFWNSIEHNIGYTRGRNVYTEIQQHLLKVLKSNCSDFKLFKVYDSAINYYSLNEISKHEKLLIIENNYDFNTDEFDMIVSNIYNDLKIPIIINKKYFSIYSDLIELEYQPLVYNYIDIMYMSRHKHQTMQLKINGAYQTKIYHYGPISPSDLFYCNKCFNSNNHKFQTLLEYINTTDDSLKAILAMFFDNFSAHSIIFLISELANLNNTLKLFNAKTGKDISLIKEDFMGNNIDEIKNIIDEKLDSYF